MQRLDHLDQELDHAAGRVELAAALALGAREAPEEVLVDATEEILGAALGVAHGDRADQVDQLAELLLVDGGAGVVLGQHALEARVLPLDRHHGGVDELADLGLLGVGLQVAPARLARHPEDVVGEILVAVFGVDRGLSLRLRPQAAPWRSSKASEMYLRKIRPRATCLYSAGSMWPRILSAAAQSFSSKPTVAPLGAFGGLLAIGGLVLQDPAGIDPRQPAQRTRTHLAPPASARTHPIRS